MEHGPLRRHDYLIAQAKTVMAVGVVASDALMVRLARERLARAESFAERSLDGSKCSAKVPGAISLDAALLT